MIRLYVEAVTPSQSVPLTLEQYHYLTHVMRLKEGDSFLIFNPLQGEFLATLHLTKKQGAAVPQKQTRRPEQKTSPVTLYIAPIRKEKMELVIQKATEIGVEVICPILTKHTCHRPLTPERAHAIMVEAAEQSERLLLPTWHPPMTLKELLDTRTGKEPLFYLSERGIQKQVSLPAPPLGFLIGPEGGFAPEEISLLEQQKNTHAINLGAFILRAETAAISILATYRFHRFFT